MGVLFPFGHGLSYTTFEYTNLRLSADSIQDTDALTVTLTVKNTGSRFGKTVAQLYVGDVESTALRPLRELKAFAKVALAPGESKDVSFTLNKRAFAYWNSDIHDWHVETGDFTIEAGDSSRSLPLKATVRVESTVDLPRHYDMNSIYMDILADPKAKAIIAPFMSKTMNALAPEKDETQPSDAAKEAITEDMSLAMLNYMPLRGALSFGGAMTDEDMEKLIQALNGD